MARRKTALVVALIGGILAVAIAAFLVVLTVFGGADTARITSRTPECEQGVLAALEALKQDRGLPFEVTGAEPAAAFEGHDIVKTYARDGSRYEVAFQVRHDEAKQCVLVFYSRDIREPGVHRSQSGNFGWAPLPGCRCTAAE